MFYVAEREQGKALVKVKKVAGTAIDKFFGTLDGTVTIRATSCGLYLPALQELQDRGAKVLTAHWHKAGLDKGLDADQIALQYLDVPETAFRPLRLRGDIHFLRQLVQTRYAFLEYRRSYQLRLASVARDLGLGKDDPRPDNMQEQLDDLKQAKKETEGLTEKRINEEAPKIFECVLLKKILGITGEDSWTTAASVVAYLGDMSRFEQVSSLWHYCGYHVVDGHAPKRQKGKNITWNPKIRTALWSWSDSMLKTKNPIWRPVYDAYRAKELAEHDVKCPNCKTKEGHCGARARRRVVKDVLTQFFVQMQIPAAVKAA